MKMRKNEVMLEFYLDGNGIVHFYENEDDGEEYLDCLVNIRNFKARRFPIEKSLLDKVFNHIKKYDTQLDIHAVYFDENSKNIKKIVITEGFKNNLYKTLEEVEAGTYKDEFSSITEHLENAETRNATRTARIFENGNLEEKEISWKNKGVFYIDDEGEECYFPSDNEHKINGFSKLMELGEFSKKINIYDSENEYEFLLEIEYGEGKSIEMILCRSFKDLIALLQQIEPLLQMIQQSTIETYLGSIFETMDELSEDSKNDKDQFNADLEYIKQDLAEAFKALKRKRFILNDISKNIIKTRKANLLR